MSVCRILSVPLAISFSIIYSGSQPKPSRFKIACFFVIKSLTKKEERKEKREQRKAEKALQKAEKEKLKSKS